MSTRKQRFINNTIVQAKVPLLSLTIGVLLAMLPAHSFATTRTRYLGGTLSAAIDAQTVSLALMTPNGRETFVLSKTEESASSTSRTYEGFSQRRAGKPNRDRAALVISDRDATIFFSSRRTGRPVAISFLLQPTQSLAASVLELRISRAHRGATIPCANEGASQAPLRAGNGDGLGMYASKAAATVRAMDSSNPLFTPPRVLQVATYADGQFATVHGRRSRAYMESSLGAASSLYLAPLGIRIKVVSTQIAPPASRGAEGDDPEKVLEEFRTKQVASFRAADLHHLFTGRSFYDSTIGIAYVAAACTAGNRYAVGLSKNVKTALQPLVAAHELAHGLSAVHDSESLSIMNPSLTTANNHFSETTRAYLREYVSGPGSCVEPTTAPEPSFTVGIKDGVFSANVSVKSWIRGNCSVLLQAQSTTSRWRTIASRLETISAAGETVTTNFATPAPLYTDRKARRYPFRVVAQCPGGKSSTPSQLVNPASAAIAAISSEVPGDWLSQLIASFRRGA